MFIVHASDKITHYFYVFDHMVDAERYAATMRADSWPFVEILRAMRGIITTEQP